MAANRMLKAIAKGITADVAHALLRAASRLLATPGLATGLQIAGGYNRRYKERKRCPRYERCCCSAPLRR
jgi:hypothetical protein